MDWAGTIFILIGFILTGNKYKWAFLYSIIGSVFWVLFAYNEEIWSLLIVNGVFIILGGINLYKWIKDSPSNVDNKNVKS